ncbi:hypothetical protein BHE90_014654 [Fusarium euwallaceae]|uniref:Uncharacterized protein n=4 Tax=Fusarium solani species complex TaxID=232080 RepID=A0A3M2RN64_9HYPO|nr:hypothetical protein CDV36_013787 [Fusarium kuroshium]RSL95128.1 hypothetical protein CEP52_012240 [Fusarium oligoseptatum]RSM20438.1 hypothetical protein CDV31_000662 [Fusarium ambrosium]RTE70949.1 hypothetical protein BHE90_014654 [Fusarium euwallaceae]
MPNYIVTEPSPSTNTYIRSGRGGYGNIRKTKDTSHKPSHTVTSSATPSRRFFSGIGGAGNAHEASEHPPISLDEEYDRIAARDHLAAGHVGIGGAGNVYHRKDSDAASDDTNASDDSSLSSKAKLWARVSSTFSRD